MTKFLSRRFDVFWLRARLRLVFLWMGRNVNPHKVPYCEDWDFHHFPSPHHRCMNCHYYKWEFYNQPKDV